MAVSPRSVIVPHARWRPPPLKPIPGHQDAFTVEMGWGDTEELAADTDGGIIERNDVAITYLTRLQHEDRDDLGSIAKALDALLG